MKVFKLCSRVCYRIKVWDLHNGMPVTSQPVRPLLIGFEKIWRSDMVWCRMRQWPTPANVAWSLPERLARLLQPRRLSGLGRRRACGSRLRDQDKTPSPSGSAPFLRMRFQPCGTAALFPSSAAPFAGARHFRFGAPARIQRTGFAGGSIEVR